MAASGAGLPNVTGYYHVHHSRSRNVQPTSYASRIVDTGEMLGFVSTL